MPNIKAAEKWARQTAKRSTRNLDVKTRLKTLFKKAASAGDASVTRSVEAQFDKAAQKGVIHPNKAARKKSRLAKAAAKTSAPPPKKSTGTRKAPARKTSRKTST